MFTGLIERIGITLSALPQDTGMRLAISCPGLNEMPRIGDSVAVSGCCLTVAKATNQDGNTILEFDVIAESLECTTLGSLSKGDPVNIELAMRADSRFGGHFVQGHIDAKAEVLAIQKIESGEERVRIASHSIDRDTLIPKGSITINGVSLTIAKVDAAYFEVCLIPITMTETTFGSMEVGQEVNIETDMITRTVAQVVRRIGT